MTATAPDWDAIAPTTCDATSSVTGACTAPKVDGYRFCADHIAKARARVLREQSQRLDRS